MKSQALCAQGAKESKYDHTILNAHMKLIPMSTMPSDKSLIKINFFTKKEQIKTNSQNY